MNARQITALSRVVTEAIDLRNERRSGLTPEDAAQEHEDLCLVIDLLEPHDGATALALRNAFGEVQP